mmetsp:Transcript_3018/g.2498  ORF Transcript_3018/g.2498 Transcript_3018/m.2498 type:complete len:84 (+) Transcript_3018:1011-1262(+)
MTYSPLKNTKLKSMCYSKLKKMSKLDSRNMSINQSDKLELETINTKMYLSKKRDYRGSILSTPFSHLQYFQPKTNKVENYNFQ